MFKKTMDIASFDPELAAALDGEVRRQEEHIELIASENYASPRVLAAQGTAVSYTHLDVYKRQHAQPFNSFHEVTLAFH